MLRPEVFMSSSVRRHFGRRSAGSSLIEVLVVIVVFMVGILAIAQIFPGGFKILAKTRDLSIGNALARNVSERLRAHVGQLPEMIAPVNNLGAIAPGRASTDYSIFDEGTPGFTLNNDGTFTDGGTTFSNYALYAGPNVFRQILGEGQTIPAPRGVGSYFGGLMVLQFGPTRQLSATETSPVNVYGNNFEVETGALPIGVVPGSRAYISDPNSSTGTLSVTVDDPTTNPYYRISCSIYTKVGATVYRRDIVGARVQSTAANTPNPGTYMVLNMSAFAPGGETYLSVDPSSIQVQRIFTAVPPANGFSATDPYQFKVLNLHMGVLLFSPVGYNYYIVRANGQREPLRARVDYQVQDWRIINDEFRLDDSQGDYKLSLSSLKVLNNQYSDALPFKGLGVQSVNSAGTAVATDVLVQDVATGGIISYDPSSPANSSIVIDKSAGTFSIVDVDSSKVNNQIWLSLPDPTQASGFAAPIEVNANGRSIRVFYMARNEWAVSPLLAAANYYEVPSGGSGPGAGQYVVSSTGVRIYFPNMDVGRKVTVDLAYYTSSADGNVHSLENQSLVVRNVPTDPNGPYVDLREADGNALNFDFSHGFAVRGLHGVSVTVRAYNNPTAFSLAGVTYPALQAYDSWTASLRTITNETFMARGGN